MVLLYKLPLFCRCGCHSSIYIGWCLKQFSSSITYNVLCFIHNKYTPYLRKLDISIKSGHLKALLLPLFLHCLSTKVLLEFYFHLIHTSPNALLMFHDQFFYMYRTADKHKQTKSCIYFLYVQRCIRLPKIAALQFLTNIRIFCSSNSLTVWPINGS